MNNNNGSINNTRNWYITDTVRSRINYRITRSLFQYTTIAATTALASGLNSNPTHKDGEVGRTSHDGLVAPRREHSQK